MKHIALAVALAAASLLGSASAANSYSLAQYTAPPLPANDWHISKVESIPAGCTLPNCLVTATYTVSNAVTGQSSSFSKTTQFGSVATVNRRGEVLLSTASNGSPTLLELYTGGSLKTVGLTAASNATAFRDDGAVIFEAYVAPNYGGALYINGQYHQVAAPFAPGSSAVNDINSAGWVAGTVKQVFTAGNGSTAVIASPTNVTTSLPGVAGYGVGGFQANALSINDSNVVVGWQANFGAATGKDPIYGFTTYQAGDPFAFIWDSVNGSRDLNSLIDPSSSLFGKVHLSYGDDIDNLGNIIARGFLLEQPGTLLTFKLSTAGAVPEPTTTLMMSLGLLAMAGVARRARRQAD